MQNPTSLHEAQNFAPWRTNCGNRRRLVITNKSPKPRLRIVQEDREERKEDREEFRRKALRNRTKNPISKPPDEIDDLQTKWKDERHTQRNRFENVKRESQIKEFPAATKQRPEGNKVKVNAVESNKTPKKPDIKLVQKTPPKQRKPIVIPKKGIPPADLSNSNRRPVPLQQSRSSSSANVFHVAPVIRRIVMIFLFSKGVLL